MASLDKDHDAVMAEVDEKSETVARLNREMEEKERSLSEAQSRVAQLEGETAHVKGQLEQKVMETIKLRSQLEGGGKEVGELRSHCETLAREENQLREDLSTMTQVLYVLVAHCMQYTCVPYHIQRFLGGYATFFVCVHVNPLIHLYHKIISITPSPRSLRQYVLSFRERFQRKNPSPSRSRSMPRASYEQRRLLQSKKESLIAGWKERGMILRWKRDSYEQKARALRHDSRVSKTPNTLTSGP